MKIRAYKESDWESILDIFTRAKPDEVRGSVEIVDIVSLNNDSGLLDSFNKSKIYVAEQNSAVVGFVGYNKYLISFLFTDPNYYKQGIGTKLLEYILSIVGSKAWLLVVETNVNAIKLYTKHGFAIAEKYIGKYNNRIDVSVVRLAMNPNLKTWLLN